MSFLAGRLASTEGSFFLQESKNAATRLAQRLPHSPSPSPPLSSPPAQTADVLPEVLRHTIPLKANASPSVSTLSPASKWSLPDSPSSSRASDAVNPLRAFASLPPVTFVPKRWSLPNSEHSISSSTANELRRDKVTGMDPEKLKAVAEGISQVGKAFAVATMIVFGGATMTFAFAASKLELKSSDDIKVKGKDLLQPKFEVFRQCFAPLRMWVERIPKQAAHSRVNSTHEKPIVRELSKRFGVRSAD